MNKKRLFLGLSIICLFFSFFGDLNALNYVSNPTKEVYLAKKTDIYGHTREISTESLNGCGTQYGNCDNTITFIKDGVTNYTGNIVRRNDGKSSIGCYYNYTYNFLVNTLNIAGNTSSTQKSAMYFLNNYYGNASELLIFNIAYNPTGLCNNNILIAINTIDNTIFRILGYPKETKAGTTGTKTLGGFFNNFLDSTTTYGQGGEWLYKNFIITLSGSNIYYSTWSNTGLTSIMQTLPNPLQTKPASKFGVFEGQDILINGTYHTIFTFIGDDNKITYFDFDDFTSYFAPYSIYPNFPFFNLGDLTKNYFFAQNGYDLRPYNTSYFQQTPGFNSFSTVFDNIDHQNFFGSGFYSFPHLYIQGSKIYFNVRNALTNRSVYSYDIACKTPGYNTCKLDINDGLSYCANDLGQYSTNKELCNDPYINIGLPVNPPGLSGGDGSIKKQTKPANYAKTTDENGDEYTGRFGDDCLYIKVSNKDYLPQQYCKSEGYNTEYGTILSETFCDYNKGYYLYFYGGYNKNLGLYQIKRALCSQTNDLSGLGSVKRFFQYKDYSFGYQVDNETGFTWIYGLANTFEPGLFTNKDYLNINNFFIDSFTGSTIEYGSGFIENMGLSRTKQTDTAFSSNKSFYYIENSDFYNSCTSTGCVLDNFATNPLFFIKIKLKGTDQTKINLNGDGFENIDGSIGNDSLFNCDTNDDGETSILEATICPFTILNNVWNELLNILESFKRMIINFMNIGNVKSTPLFGFSFFEKAHADYSNPIGNAFSSGASLAFDGGGFFSNMYNYLYYFTIGLLFITIIIIILLYKLRN